MNYGQNKLIPAIYSIQAIYYIFQLIIMYWSQLYVNLRSHEYQNYRYFQIPLGPDTGIVIIQSKIIQLIFSEFTVIVCS